MGITQPAGAAIATLALPSIRPPDRFPWQLAPKTGGPWLLPSPHILPAMIEGSGARAISARLTRPLVVCFNTGVSTFQRHPFLVKTVSSGIGFAVGDAFTQLATRRKEEPYDWARTAAMGGAGLCVAGPLGYGFIVWMEGNVMASASTR